MGESELMGDGRRQERCLCVRSAGTSPTNDSIGCIPYASLRAGRGDTEGALKAIEQAIRVDPYAEELYRRAISLLGELDRGDVARQLFRQLGARLSDLDVDPEEETVHLLNRLSAKGATAGGPRRG